MSSWHGRPGHEPNLNQVVARASRPWQVGSCEKIVALRPAGRRSIEMQGLICGRDAGATISYTLGGMRLARYRLLVRTKFTKWSNFVREAWLIKEKWNKRSCLKPPMNADARRCSAPLIGVDRRPSGSLPSAV